MPERPIHHQSLMEVSTRIRRGETTSVEVTRAMLDRIAALDGELRAYSVVMADSAMEAAAAADGEIAAGNVRGPLHGVPVAVKDLCRTNGVRTRAGMPLLNDYVPDYDSTAVVRFREAGAVLLGKLELTEGAFACHHPDVAAPVNPWNPEYWPGASSSGSGVATATGMCYGSLGSDTGGSIRFPSLACAVTGLKPTWGRVSRHGVFMLSDTLDHLGPMARTAEDCAALLGAIAGRDDNDHHTSLEPVPDYLAELEKGIGGLRIGWDEEHCTHDVDPEVAGGVRAALRDLERAGAEIVEDHDSRHPRDHRSLGGHLRGGNRGGPRGDLPGESDPRTAASSRPISTSAGPRPASTSAGPTPAATTGGARSPGCSRGSTCSSRRRIRT